MNKIKGREVDHYNRYYKQRPKYTLKAKFCYDTRQRRVYYQASRKVYLSDNAGMFSLDLITGSYGYYGPIKKLP